MELRLGKHLLENASSDCFRGVQAVLVDKTRPVWNPDRLEDISNTELDRQFDILMSFPELNFTDSSSKL